MVQLGGGEIQGGQARQTWSRLHLGKGLLSCCWHGGSVERQRKKHAGHRDGSHHCIGDSKGSRQVNDGFNSNALEGVSVGVLMIEEVEGGMK